MVNLHVTYEGELRCLAVHGPSDNRLFTDAPVDNKGRGETFSPTDLVGTALGSCMLTVMAIATGGRQPELKGTTVHVTKEMTTERPRRIERLSVRVTFPAEVSQTVPEATRRELENLAVNCPVRLSLSDAIDIPIEFTWQ